MPERRANAAETRVHNGCHVMDTLPSYSPVHVRGSSRLIPLEVRSNLRVCDTFVVLVMCITFVFRLQVLVHEMGRRSYQSQYSKTHNCSTVCLLAVEMM